MNKYVQAFKGYPVRWAKSHMNRVELALWRFGYAYRGLWSRYYAWKFTREDNRKVRQLMEQIGWTGSFAEFKEAFVDKRQTPQYFNDHVSAYEPTADAPNLTPSEAITTVQTVVVEYPDHPSSLVGKPLTAERTISVHYKKP